MATIDVSELMSDPDFLECITVTRTQQTTDSNGRTVASGTPVTVNIRAVVQAATGRTLRMMPDLTNVEGVIDVYTKFRLEGPSDTTSPDVITWRNRNYIIATVQSYANYGRGFVHAVATMQQVTASAPCPVPASVGP